MSPECVKKNKSLLNWIVKNKTQLCFDYSLPDLSLIENIFPEVKGLSLSNYAGDAIEQTCPPALKNLNFEVLNSLQQACKQGEKPEWIFLWAEKLLRVCDLRRLDLQTRINENINKKDGRIKSLRLCLFFLNCFYIFNDARYVNIVLKIIDLKWLNFKNADVAVEAKFNEEIFLQILITLFVEHAIGIISDVQWSPEISEQYRDRQIDQIKLPMCKLFEKGPEVIIFSPNPFGITTLCIAELFKIHGINVKAIVVRRLFNPKRLLQEIKRDGLKWVFRKITHKLLFRKRTYQNCSFKTIVDYAQEIGMEHSNVGQWCQANNAEQVICDTLNDKCVQDYLAKTKPRLVTFAGGGILKEKTLALAGDGVVNCHGGLLPRYRGLDLYEWPILERHSKEIGYTTHFMSKYVDEGDLFYMCRLDIKGNNTFDEIIKSGEVSQVKLMVYTVINYLQDAVKSLTQSKNDGRQFFYMHPRLVEIARCNLEAAK